MTRLALLLVLMFTYACHADAPVAGLAKDLAQASGAMPGSWQLNSATAGRASETAPAPVGSFNAMTREGETWTANGSSWRVDAGKLIAAPAAGQLVVASHTVQPGGGGFYSINDSLFRRSAKASGRLELRIFVRRHDGRDEPPAVRTFFDAEELFDFDTFLGYVDAGDSIHVAVGSAADASGNEAEVDFSIVRAPGYPVSTFRDGSSEWAILRDVPAGSVAGRIVAWNADPASPTLEVKPGADRETIAAFRVPHSGYYALHDATASATTDVKATIYAGRDTAPRRTVTVTGSRTSLGCDVGYVEKGGVIYVAFTNAGAAEAQVAFERSVVEWAPRTPPLRVARGEDGYLDVYEPAHPLTPIDIPPANWVSVPAGSGDASDAIRKAFEQARSLQQGDGYTGVRLERGATYAVATDQVGGDLFALKDLRHIVFDGNGATLNVTSKEFPRKGIKLFHVSNCQGLVLGDFTLRATSVPFAIGEVTHVGPMEGGNQTVTFRLEPDSLDPIADIARNGNGSAYCYDPNIPGRLAVGTWTHYPGASAGGQPQIRTTNDKGVFTHTVTRTGQSIPVGAKWLVKNKGAGLAYLTTRGGTEDVTLWKVTGRASGGGLLYFWQTSRINILDCSFEPDGDNWIGSSSDAVHGRGREGVWIEDTIIRGVCEDVMNTYATTNVVAPDDDPNDNVYSIRALQRPGGDAGGGQWRAPSPPSQEVIRVGEKLVFFNPKTGHVLGHAIVRDIQDGRFTLSTNIPDVETFEPGDDRSVTVVYNTASAARFVVRDSRFMDSMRFAVYIKAQGGVMWGNTFDGFSSPAVFVANEPEWPEGPPGTHVWVQGNTFSQNNFGYMSRHRAFTAVDPADVSIYTRHLRQPNSPTDFTGFITRGQYANSHVKIIGNTFHDWRGGGIAIRNARNVDVSNNLFLAPVEDSVLRDTFRHDPARKGTYAAIFFDSIDGASVQGNRFVGLPSGDHGVLTDQQVTDVIAIDNEPRAIDLSGLDVQLHFNEWFGDSSQDTAGSGKNPARLRGASHVAGRLGAGLMFDGGQARAVLSASPEVGGKASAQFTLAMWARPTPTTTASQVLYSQADADRGVVLAIDHNRFVAGIWQGEHGVWLDLGPAVPDRWQHVSLVFNGADGTTRGFVDGIEVAVLKQASPTLLGATTADAVLGGAAVDVRFGPQRIIPANATAYHGMIDEFHLFNRALSLTDIAILALRLPADVL